MKIGSLILFVFSAFGGDAARADFFAFFAFGGDAARAFAFAFFAFGGDAAGADFSAAAREGGAAFSAARVCRGLTTDCEGGGACDRNLPVFTIGVMCVFQ